MQFFIGKGYDEKFVNNMNEVINELKKKMMLELSFQMMIFVIVARSLLMVNVKILKKLVNMIVT